MQTENSQGERLMALPPVLRAGFRPFFLAAAIWALVSVGLWIAVLAGIASVPSHFDPLAWHRHEMLFGFLSAVIAGFLLTAIPNWTGRPPFAGAGLAGLVALWLAARLCVLLSSWTGGTIAATLDVGFMVILAMVSGREIVAARNRNLPLVAVIAALATADALDHAEALGHALPPGLGWRMGFGLILLLIALIGGRIIPTFTRNWLAKQRSSPKLPAPADHFDLITLLITVAGLAAWIAVPEARASSGLLIAAGVAQFARLCRWCGHRTVREPLVLMLHVAYAWLPIGLLLLGLESAGSPLPPGLALHSLSAGAMASMVLAVMTRATLGHTGRELRADAPTVWIYGLVTIGAVLRVLAPLLSAFYLPVIAAAGTSWAGAFALFVLAYGPALLRTRKDGKP